MKRLKNKKYLKKTKKFFLNVWDIMGKPEMAILPGQLAFFVILSLVPIITIIGYGASFFNISVDSIMGLLEANFSKGIVNLIEPIISGDTIDLKLLIMFGVMFYIASNGADSIIVASNEIYNIKQTSWIKRRFKAILLTFVIVILILFVMLVPAFGTKIIDAVDYFNIKSTIASVLEIIQGPISWLIIFSFIKIIYTISPDKPVPTSGVNFGAVFSTVGWVIATYLYSYWINNFASYDIFYAGLSNIAVLMLWIYILSYIFVIGMILNHRALEAEMEITGSLN
ncbi:MAG: YihY/virulence factor BrkB family protein [Bacilli bacterium]|nr:YihY/virulence factor BrkB family protein [Bacilli bacterium]MDD4795551.1 YihY/virulence factor BrkB family protein [Bacilli bacterium]